MSAQANRGHYYVVSEDGAITMPMSKKTARSHALIFGGQVKTNNPDLGDRLSANVTLVRLIVRDRIGQALLWLVLPFVVGRWGLGMVMSILVDHGIIH